MKTITIEQADILISEGEKLSPVQRTEIAKTRLNELVDYARKHSGHYKEAYKDIKESFEISELPKTNKQELMADFEAWVTDPEVTLFSLREYLANPENVSKGYLGRYSVLTTSGTTGEPMPFVRDSYHNIIHGTLLKQRLFGPVGPEFMDVTKTKTACVIAMGGFASSYSAARRMKARINDKSDNLGIFSIITPLDELVTQLNDFDPVCLTGYPSILKALAIEKLRGSLTASPKAIISSAETLSIEAFETLTTAFNCPVLNNYCSTEIGEIAMTCNKGRLHLNDDWVILEPIDEKFNPVKTGEWSTGVLMTDLSNYVQPVIRYFFNDFIRFDDKPCECGINLPIIEISGRLGEPLFFNGKTLTSPVLGYFMMSINDLLSWQLIQTDDNTMEVRYIETYGLSRTEKNKEIITVLKKSLKDYGCGDVNVTISDKKFIRARGGKEPYVINLVASG
jgi:phenylacetate-coenzyme A ligase PaaK-like adenylate-forming protein